MDMAMRMLYTIIVVYNKVFNAECDGLFTFWKSIKSSSSFFSWGEERLLGMSERGWQGDRCWGQAGEGWWVPSNWGPK